MRHAAAGLAFAAALIGEASAAAGLQVNTPTSVQCQPTQFDWADAIPPYTVTLLFLGNDPNASEILSETVTIQRDSNLTFSLNQAAGNAMLYNVSDSTGLFGLSNRFTIQSSADSSCLNSAPQPGTGSSSASTSLHASTSTESASATRTAGASATESSRSTGSAQSHNKASDSPVGLAVGLAIGGLAALVLLIVALLSCNRRRKIRSRVERDKLDLTQESSWSADSSGRAGDATGLLSNRQTTPDVPIHTPPVPVAVELSSADQGATAWAVHNGEAASPTASEANPTSSNGLSGNQRKPSTQKSRGWRPPVVPSHSPLNDPVNASSPVSVATVSHDNAVVEDSNPGSYSQAGLTEEQGRFIAQLQRQGVPATDVIQIIAGMRNGRIDPHDAPPEYRSEYQPS